MSRVRGCGALIVAAPAAACSHATGDQTAECG